MNGDKMSHSVEAQLNFLRHCMAASNFKKLHIKDITEYCAKCVVIDGEGVAIPGLTPKMDTSQLQD